MIHAPWPFGSTLRGKHSSRKNRHVLRKTRCASIQYLEPRVVLTADPTISEFQAINATTLQDEDGDFEDWIEVRNANVESFNLDGWYLTDDGDDLQKWQFPAVSVEGGQQIVVFASNKDRTDPESQLHTNFRLDGDGEYLALVRPDGTVAHDFGEQYPPQIEDQSYGVAIRRDVVPLVEEQAPVTATVPTDDGLGNSWTQGNFDDQAWFSGKLGVGYEVLRPGTTSRDDFDSPSLSPEWTVDLPDGALSTVEVDNGDLVLTVPNGEDLSYRNRGTAPMVYRDLPRENSVDFEIITSVTKQSDDDGAAGIVVVDKATGAPAIQFEYNEDRFFRLVTGGREQDNRRDSNETAFLLRLVRDGIEKTWTAYQKKTEAGEWREIGVATDGVNATPVLNDLAVGVYARTPQSTMNARFSYFEINIPGDRPVYGPETGLNLGNEMFNNNASAYMRIPFTLDEDPARFDELGMTVRYDDGFRAYLNGVEVADRNVPVEATWNSEAAGTFGAVNGRIPSVLVNLSGAIDQLRRGENILAIHGMNVSSLDTDFFFDAQLIASEVLDESTQFFIIPTPGEPNDLPAAPTPRLVGEQGVFFGSQVVSLEVDFVDPQLVVRYTLDGTSPTPASTLYEGPITLTESAMLQARTFDASAEVRFDPSNAASGTFFAVDEELRNRTSDIPLVILDTLGQGIPGSGATTLRGLNVVFFDVSKATGRSSIDGIVDYLGRGGVRDRGSSTAGQPKPNMSFETWGPDGTTEDDDFNTSLVGLPAESDWVLHAPYNFDRALIRNQIFMGLSNRIDRYAPRTRAVEVYLNRRDGTVTEGDYAGTYVLMEKIKRGPDRVDIQRITPEDNDPNSEEITGGYIFKIDRADPGEPPFSAGGQSVNWVEPKSPRGRADEDQKATQEQENWITNYINEFRTTIRENPDINDPEGYTKYIDADAWIDHHLVNVLTFNVDALRLSAYFFKDRSKPMEFGPLWDCDRCMESTDGRDDNPLKWFDGGGTSFFTYPWWGDLFNDPGFWQRYIDRWQEFRKDVFSREGIDDLIDELAAEVEESSERNFEQWRSVRPRRSSAYQSGELDGTWQGEVEHLRDWMHARAEFMDMNFVQPPRYLIDGQELGDVKGVQVDAGTEVTILGPPVVFFDDSKLISGTPGATTARYFVPTDDLLGDTWTSREFDDSAWSAGATGLGFDSPDGDFAEVIRTTVRPSDVADTATTILSRMPFVIDDLTALNDKEFVLRMKFDDGFVAYINGVEVHRQNLDDGDLSWDSRASSRRTPRDRDMAAQFIDFDITPFKDQLVQGTNILSIRGVNATTGSDMLVLPELVSRVTRTEPNPNAKVYYTSDGTDPRGPDGMPSPSAIEIKIGETVVINSNTRLISRNFDDITDRGSESSIVETDWSSPAQYDFVVSSAELAISEINYNPSGANMEEEDAGFGNDDFEFVEILNTGATEADLIGVELTDGVRFDFLESSITTLAPGAHLLVVRNQEAFQMRYGDDLPVAGVYDGSLDNDGEDLNLIIGTGEVVFSVNYADSDPWPVRPDGVGATLELVDPAGVLFEEQSKWYSWRGSTEVDGSPGTSGEGSLGIVVNEVLARTEAPVTDPDAIELHNLTGAPLDISGWGLSDSGDNFFKYNFPAGTTIAARGYLVVTENEFNPANPPDGNTPFGLSGREGDSVWLVRQNGDFVDDVHFRATLNGESLGRTPNATGRLAPLMRTSFGAENGSPRVGPIVITEVQYNPVLSDIALEVDPNLDASDLEFIEIHNPTAAAVDLTDWRLRGGIDFNYADGTPLAAGETIVMLKFNPDDPENINQVNAFRAHYGIDESVRLLGGYSGQLNNSDDKILLLRPDAPPADDPELVIRVQEDEVLYDDLPPWPTSADGTGHSLQRKSPDAFGNVGESWNATIPTPGSPESSIRGDFNGDGLVNEIDINLLFVQMRSDDPDLSFDLTEDGKVDEDDRDELIQGILMTNYGDANLDRVFNSTDLVQVFAAGEYEDNIPLNSLWQTGDWDGNGDFDTSDLVLAFASGAYDPAAIARQVSALESAAIGAALAHDDLNARGLTADEAALGRIVADRPLQELQRVEILEEALESLFK